jgi:peptidoglycan/LPS O-acetylase OafA/YrhL
MRGVAALMVVLLHIPMIGGQQIKPATAYLAVDLFFLLSGFVIAHAYDSRLEGGLAPKDFLIARLIRLYPIYAIGLGLGLLAVATQWLTTDTSPSVLRLTLALVTGLLFLPFPANGADGDVFTLNFPAWSLFFELAANLVFAVLWPRLSAAWLGAIVVASAACLIAMASIIGTVDGGTLGTNFWMGAPRVAFGFFAGVALYRLRDRLPHIAAPAWAILALVIAALAYAPAEQLKAAYELFVVLVAGPALLTLAIHAGADGVVRALAVWTGAISYAVYVIHAPLRDIARIVMRQWGLQPSLWLGLAFVAVTLVLASAATTFVEPRLRSRLAMRATSRNASQSA